MATTEKTDEERRRAAKAFVERWTYRRGSEKGEDQQFWNDLLRSVLGAEDVEARIRYQVPVPMRGTTKFLDAWIPETRVLVEHNTTLVVPHATWTHFGVLTSSVHMAWMRAVAGRLEMRYRYSAAVVYNNFPWPEAAGETVARTAQAILDARARHPEASLADLYDPLTMPEGLRAAHAANDRAVLAAYGLAADTPEPAIIAHLFSLYAERTKGR